MSLLAKPVHGLQLIHNRDLFSIKRGAGCCRSLLGWERYVCRGAGGRHRKPAAARLNGLQVVHVQDEDKSWDFKTRSAFEAFGSVTFVEWTRLLPAQEEPNFVGDVLDRYRLVASEKPGEENTFQVLSDGHRASPLKTQWF